MRVRDERTLLLDPVVEQTQLGSVAVDAESRHDPHDEAQEVHDRRNVEEHALQRLRANVGDLETGSFGTPHARDRVHGAGRAVSDRG